MNNLKVFNNSSRRKFLKILGVSMVGTLGYSLYNTINKDNLKKSYWTGSVINAPAKIEQFLIENYGSLDPNASYNSKTGLYEI